MAEKQVTTMVIKVGLECEKCAKKIKKVLCAIPQIQNQVYDKKANTVTITVVCCSPEKIKQKICCKGGETIKGIETKVPGKAPDKVEKPDPEPTSKPQEQVPKPTPRRTCCRECYEGGYGGPCFHWYVAAPPCYVEYGRLAYYSWGGGSCSCGYYVCRCEYVCDDNRCIIM